MWCGPCFKTEERWDFHVREQVDEEGLPLVEEDRETRFKTARAGDHLVTTFQCPLCHFRNIKSRDPEEGYGPDDKLMGYIRQCCLDSFWSSSEGTIVGAVKEARRMNAFKDEFRIDSFTPSMGPFPLEDSLGMLPAVAVLRRSMDAGMYEARVQPNTFRKMATAITNITRASAAGLGDAIGRTGKGGMTWVSGAGTHTRWFGKFMAGLKMRVGEVVKQDEPVSIEVLLKIEELLEAKWERATTDEEREAIATMGAWFMGCFCTGIRGEEALRIELAGTAKSLENLEPGRHPIPYFLFAINGRTKMNQDAGAKAWLPCAGTTGYSKLKPGKWVSRLVDLLRFKNRTNGFLFSKHHGGKSKLQDFADEFYSLLEAVQEGDDDLISWTVNVREAYGIWRSLRRGVTAHAINRGVPESLIRQINRWRGETTAGGRSAREILAVYAELQALIPSTIKYSWKL